MSDMTYEELQEQYSILQKKLKYFEEYDLLTGSYNKWTFYEKADQVLRKSNEQYDIVCIDIERFKVINDLFGTETGNLLLKFLAKELKKDIFGEPCIFARLASDIYAVCMPAQLSAEALEDAVLKVFQRAPVDIVVVPAIGIYQVKDRKQRAEKMCDRAIMALESVKGNYQKHCMVYSEALWNDMMQEQEIVGRADFALKQEEFQIYMQPKCNIKTGKIVGAEALVRWNHAEKGIISPGVFIPVFEKNGFIKKLDAYIWEKVAVWIREFIESGNQPIPISVNVSRLDIMGMDLLAILDDIVNRNHIPVSLLELEITESAYSNHPEEIIMTVEKLMSAGYTVLMDDFGSGYSSLNMLKDININILKLDLRFLDNTNQKSRDILESIVHMAKWLNLHIIAEGVETKEQVNFLHDIGCEYAQGFYYYTPMPLPDFMVLLAKEKNIDYEDHKRSLEMKQSLIKFKDLFHADMMSEQLLNNILGSIALYEFDGTSLNMTRCNHDYYELVYNKEMGEDIGQYDILPFIRDEDRELLLEALHAARQQKDKGAVVNIRRYVSLEDFIWLEVRLFYLTDTNGKSLYYAGIEDITAQKKAFEDLKMSEQRFRIAMEALSSTLFEVDIKTRVATFARHTQEEYGLEDCVADAPEGFIRQGSVCDDYVETFREMYYAIYRGEDSATCVIQANMGDGCVMWNRITLIAVKDKNGTTIKAVGLVENISREKELEERLLNMKTKNTEC